MAKFIRNTSKGIICLETKNFIPGEPGIPVTDEEAAHPMIAAYIKAGKLELTETETETILEDMTTNQLKAYAKANGVDLGGATKKEEILNAIKAAEEGQ